MNPSLFRIFFPALLLSLISVPGVSAKEEGLKESYGVVKKITGDQMIVSVLDPKKKELKEETFKLQPDTELVIVRPASEVMEGDEVKINYAEDKGNKVSKFVSIIDLAPPAKTES